MTTTLDQLSVGEEVRVEAIHGEKGFRLRLLEMGLTPRTRISIVRVAPLGDPLTINVRGTRISIRKAEAADIEVRPLTTAMEALREAGSFRVAIAGNPNTGKSTLFNALTGEHVQVGNYPGITVERVVGTAELPGGANVELVDVPGTYSLNARSRDEQVAIDELLGNAGAGLPDAVVVVLNATAMERSVYLLLQVQELAIPTLAVVNMLDEARDQNIAIDLKALADHLHLPAVGVVARTGEGLDELSAALERLLQDPPDPEVLAWHWQPSENLEEHLDEVGDHVECLVGKNPPSARRRAVALWCLMSLSKEDDLEGIAEDLRETVLGIRQEMESHGHDLDLEVTQARYEHIDEDSPEYLSGALAQETRADRIDAVLTHPVKGSLIFLMVMASVFWAIFELATPLVDLLESGAGALQRFVAGALPEGFLADLLVQGILGGVGAVVVFLPQILILFFLITLLESSGYMARAAVVIDRLMMKMGLHGKAFVPMISGFACCVPAILATRTIASRRDRLLTIMVLPLISCSARLPVYTLIIAALFPADRSILGPISLGMAMLFGLYVLSTILSILAAAVLGRTVLAGQPAPMLLELPPYRLPSAGHVGRVLWDRTKTFLKTAGTVIVIASTILWGLLSFPKDVPLSRDYGSAIAGARAAGQMEQARRLESRRAAEALEHSYAGRVGRAIEPAIEPLGFDWKIGVGLLGSLAAREVFVATMGLIYGVGEVGDDDRSTMLEALRNERRVDGSRAYTPLVGFSLLVFFMIALQCISTIAVSRQETGSWRWTLFQLVYITALAYLASLVVYQGGRALGLG